MTPWPFEIFPELPDGPKYELGAALREVGIWSLFFLVELQKWWPSSQVTLIRIGVCKKQLAFKWMTWKPSWYNPKSKVQFLFHKNFSFQTKTQPVSLTLKISLFCQCFVATKSGHILTLQVQSSIGRRLLAGTSIVQYWAYMSQPLIGWIYPPSRDIIVTTRMTLQWH